MLIPSPATISDGTSNHIFTFQNTVPVNGSVVSSWLELAAAAAIASKMKSKYKQGRTGLNLSVLQYSRNLAIADASLVPATFNISIVHHPQHTEADLTLMGITLKNAALQTDFWKNIIFQM
jgi:hypothetical protein